MYIVITRPVQQAQSLATKLQALGHEIYLLPCVTIKVDINNATFQKAIQALLKTNYVIFTSSNAAHIALPHFPAPQKMGACKLFAIGPATATMIQSFDYKCEPALIPANTTTLLTHSLLQSGAIHDKYISIFCGYDPKPTLYDVLVQRHAHVNYGFCYKRNLPKAFDAHTLQKLHMYSDVCFVSTSMNLLNNLIQLMPSHLLPWLYQQPLIVIHDKMAIQAKQYGFKCIYMAENASTSAIITTLLALST